MLHTVANRSVSPRRHSVETNRARTKATHMWRPMRRKKSRVNIFQRYRWCKSRWETKPRVKTNGVHIFCENQAMRGPMVPGRPLVPAFVFSSLGSPKVWSLRWSPHLFAPFDFPQNCCTPSVFVFGLLWFCAVSGKLFIHLLEPCAGCFGHACQKCCFACFATGRQHTCV